MVVLDILVHIQHHLDPSLSFRWECRKGICGICGVMMNDRPVLACQAAVDPDDDPVITPLRHFPVIKDLVIDFSIALERLKRLRPYLDHSGHRALIKKAEADASKSFRSCIECWLCVAACPVVEKCQDCLDPIGVVKLARFAMDPRDILDRRKIAQVEGIAYYKCEECCDCSAICPQEIDIPKAIRILRATLKNGCT
jgi:succinate dehydrogenase/fumarate reductase iron-sulfur protein